jgi:predicted dehydrogenase
VGTEVERVFAEARSDLNVAGEDSLLGLLRFAAAEAHAGALGSLDVNWLAPRRIRDLNVRGEKGLFALDYTAQTLDYYKYGGTLPIGSRGWSPTGEGAHDAGVRIPIEPMEPLGQELLAFVTALRDGTPMPVTADDALAALAICDALTESARTGLPVIPAPVR